MIELSVNGRPRKFRGPAFKRLIDVLREDFRLTGTKEGCSEGECGACTVLVDGRPVNSCLIPVAQVAGRKIETIEGLGSPESMHLLQESFLQKGGAQCGICSPGMILCALSWMRQGGGTNPDEIRRYLAGNLCRCTGYQPIVEAVIRAVEGARAASGHGTGHTKGDKRRPSEVRTKSEALTESDKRTTSGVHAESGMSAKSGARAESAKRPKSEARTESRPRGQSKARGR